MSEKPFEPTNWREGRRLRAWELKQQGWRQKDIAEALGVTPGAVSQWLKKAREKGASSLRHKPSPGAPRRLSDDQLARLPVLLEQGPEQFGFRGEIWMRKRVAALIWQEFGVRYSERHTGRILETIGWTRQKPATRARQRDEAAIEEWRAERWEELQKKPSSSAAR